MNTHTHSPTTTLFVARHGQSELNNQRVVTGQLNPALSTKGVAQSRALAHLLRDEPLRAVYTSILTRSVQSAAPTARMHGLTPIALPALNEINMGVLQGRHRDERDSEAAALWQQWKNAMWRYRVPGAESFVELQQRVAGALTEILERHSGETLLIVGHRAVNRILLGTLLALPKEQWPGLTPSNKILHRIRLRGESLPEHTELAYKQENKKHGTEPLDAAHVAA